MARRWFRVMDTRAMVMVRTCTAVVVVAAAAVVAVVVPVVVRAPRLEVLVRLLPALPPLPEVARGGNPAAIIVLRSTARRVSDHASSSTPFVFLPSAVQQHVQHVQHVQPQEPMVPSAEREYTHTLWGGEHHTHTCAAASLQVARQQLWRVAAR